MARPSYGPEAKKRSLQLLTALLDYGNDLLDCDDVALDGLRSHIQAFWQTEQRLVVRTKIRYLEALSKLATPLSGEQIKEALRRFEDFLEILEDNRPHRGGSETWHFTLNLWYKKSDRTANLRRFEEEWEQRRPQKSKQVAELPPLVDTATDVWWQWCQDLEAQQYQRLTTNPLTVTDGVTFALQELYMPLELVERQQHDKRDVDVKPDAGSSLYEPESDETAQVLALETFLESLEQPESPQRIAIVGEPGSGKTTLLQKIATWLLDKHALPIWISLADLQEATLEQYLLQDWLKQVTRQVSVTPELQASLAQQFHQGRVWLLLDAVDEMATDGSTALAAIARQLRGWVADAHVILTCRLNMWDGSKNALFTFTTYRNLSFSYGNSTMGDRVEEFIHRWFGDNLVSADLAARLRLELDKPERRRLKDAVKNPLRLALLCRSWALTQGTLPTTKATLYQQFVETIYEWKQDRFSTTLATRQQLNQALGELALQALAQPAIRFRLPQSFVQQAFKQAIEFMPLALQLGWLNQVGISSTSGEKVYAFYHPTFQEYFAAMAIADWQFFYKLLDPPIFAPQWREVILLWLGRTDISIADKEAFIQALTEFKDGCGNFYHYQAYFLAAAGLAEFSQCSKAPAILAQLIDWRFGAATWQEPRLAYPVPLSEGARVALLQTDRASAIASLEQFVQSTSNLFAGWNAACTLGKTLDPGNPHAITALTQIIQTVHSENLRLQIADSLGKVDPGNAIAIRTVIEILESTQKEVIRRKSAYCLGKIDPGNSQAIAALQHLITSTTDSTLQLQAAENLKILAPTNSLTFVRQKPQIARTSRKHQIAKVKNLDKAISTLERGLLMKTDAANQRRIAYRLATLQPGHTQAIAILLQLLLAPQPSTLYKRLALNLKEVLLDEQLAEIVPLLRNCSLAVEKNMSLADKSDQSIQAHECYKLLWHCAQRMTYSSFYQAWIHN